MKKLKTEIGIIDHVLAALGCMLAVYSVGMSLANTNLALFFTIGIGITAFAGFNLAKKARGTQYLNYDSYLFAAGGISSVIFISPLNNLLPGGGFPFALIAASVLCWMLLFGNLFAWRDQTLLFLTLPCIGAVAH